MSMTLDFEGLAALLLQQWAEWVPLWSPGGKVVGREYCAGSVRGGPGDSFKFNTEKGLWADFATGEKGGDMISLYAAVQGMKNGEAAKKLADLINFSLSGSDLTKLPAKVPSFNIIVPPQGVYVPKMIHPGFGEPSASWCYRDEKGVPVFYEARYETANGKQFSPWSWDGITKHWIMKGYPSPRPIYGLHSLTLRKKSPVLIVEGPKCADAATRIMGNNYVAVTWSNGSQSVTRTDWTPLQGRNVLIWPDADEPGLEAANKLAEILLGICLQVKVLDVSDMPKGWDVADAYAEGWDWEKTLEWARPRAREIEKPKPEVKEEAPPAIAITESNVIINTGEDQEIVRSHTAIFDELGLALNNNGMPVFNLDNAMRVLERHKDLNGVAWFDSFHQKIYTNWNGEKREWSDRDTLELLKYFQREIGLIRLSDAMVFQAVTLYAHAHPRNEPRDWMETLNWDGMNRIELCFVDCLGSEDNVYVRKASSNFWIGMVARVLRPGCKMDNMVILEGAQGMMKSTALRRIGGDWFTETNESVTNKDFFLIMQGKMLIEIAELHTFSKAEVTRIKQVVSCQTDRYRAPYERLVADHPRQSIFCGSTNESTYLRDTSNRRFWPVKCGVIKPDLITEWREQMFAEAVHRFKAGETWWEMPKYETEFAQEDRRQADEWETAIGDYLTFTSLTETTIPEIATGCLKIDIGKMDVNIQGRIGKVLRKIGWDQSRELNGSGYRRVWKKKVLDSSYSLAGD